MKKIILLVALMSLSACTNEEKTISTLHKAGFTNVSAGGYSFFECGDDYTYHTEFTATNPQGQVVSGTVCCGLLKGCTIKF